MDDPRIERINSDRWIGFSRSKIVERRLLDLMATPRQSRMPGLVVYGASGMGKTMIARKFAADFPSVYDPHGGTIRAPLLLLQAPPAPDERRFYLHILTAIGAPLTRHRTIGELEVRTMSFLKDLGTRMIVIDEVHNLLAGSFREQRRFLNALRFMTNELEASLACFGVNEAIDAIRGDTQLARRLDEHHLPNWEDDVEFSQLVLTLIKAMELRQPSVLELRSLRHILAVTGGVTSRVFTMVKALAIEAIETGTEKITDEAVGEWRPTWLRRTWIEAAHYEPEF